VAKSAQLADENLVLAKKLRSAEQQAEQSTGYAQEVRKGLTQALEKAVLAPAPILNAAQFVEALRRIAGHGRAAGAVGAAGAAGGAEPAGGVLGQLDAAEVGECQDNVDMLQARLRRRMRTLADLHSGGDADEALRSELADARAEAQAQAETHAKEFAAMEVQLRSARALSAQPPSAAAAEGEQPVAPAVAAVAAAVAATPAAPSTPSAAAVPAPAAAEEPEPAPVEAGQEEAPAVLKRVRALHAFAGDPAGGQISFQVGDMVRVVRSCAGAGVSGACMRRGLDWDRRARGKGCGAFDVAASMR
jgi:hypothetical protein